MFSRFKMGDKMILSYLRTSFRNLFRHRLYTLVNILGLAVGMAACILVSLFLQHEFSYDAYHRDIDRIHRVMRLVHPSGGGLPYYPFGTQYRAGSTLVDELPEIEDMTHFITRPMWAGLEDRGFDVRGTVADPNFLRFFTFPLIDGSQPPELTPGSRRVSRRKSAGACDRVLHHQFSGHPRCTRQSS